MCINIFYYFNVVVLLVKYELEYKDMFMVCYIKEIFFIIILMFYS